MESSAPYTRDELQTAGAGFPDRGLRCPLCNTLVPQFAELSDADEQRILELIRNGESLLAMAELQRVASCPERWAKIWVVHSGRPGVKIAGAPCPHCGQPLRTAEAMQCPHCFADWH